MFQRIVRVPTARDVADLVAERLLAHVGERLQEQERVDICLTGGNTANMVYERVAELAPGADIDVSRVHLWWGDERFVSATDPDRNSLQAVERLARTIPIHSTHIHMMAAADGRKDAHESAEEYEHELSNTRFDLVLLGIGEDGHCGSIFPGHPSFEATNRLAIGVENSPKPPSDRITLTLNALTRTPYVWFIATGASKAHAVAGAIAGDESLPSAHVRGERGTLWFLDDAAAAELPPMHEPDF